MGIRGVGGTDVSHWPVFSDMRRNSRYVHLASVNQNEPGLPNLRNSRGKIAKATQTDYLGTYVAISCAKFIHFPFDQVFLELLGSKHYFMKYHVVNLPRSHFTSFCSRTRMKSLLHDGTNPTSPLASSTPSLVVLKLSVSSAPYLW